MKKYQKIHRIASILYGLAIIAAMCILYCWIADVYRIPIFAVVMSMLFLAGMIVDEVYQKAFYKEYDTDKSYTFDRTEDRKDFTVHQSFFDCNHNKWFKIISIGKKTFKAIELDFEKVGF